MYGYTGYSPRVTLYAFKEGKQSQVATRRKIGNYAYLSLDCPPTGEAMAAVADLLDDVAHNRRLLIVLTDGIADNLKLFAYEIKNESTLFRVRVCSYL